MVPGSQLSFAGLKPAAVGWTGGCYDSLMTHHAWGQPFVTVKRRCAEGIIMQETELKLEFRGRVPERS